MTNQFDEESDAAKDALGLGDEADELSALKKSGGDVEAKSGGDVEAQKSGGDVEVGGETPDSGGDVE